MSEAAIVFRKFEFTHEGMTWELQRPSNNTQAGYARHLRKRVIDGINADRQVLGEYAYQIAVKDLSSMYASGRYGWGAPAFFESLGDPENCQKLLFIWFSQNYPSGNREMHLSEKRIAEMWETRRDDFDKLIGEALHDPNPSTPPAA